MRNKEGFGMEEVGEGLLVGDILEVVRELMKGLIWNKDLCYRKIYLGLLEVVVVVVVVWVDLYLKYYYCYYYYLNLYYYYYQIIL